MMQRVAAQRDGPTKITILHRCDIQVRPGADCLSEQAGRDRHRRGVEICEPSHFEEGLQPVERFTERGFAGERMGVC